MDFEDLRMVYHMLTIEEIKEKITPVAKKYEVPLIYLFGSFAREESHQFSDVDLAIVMQNSKVDNLLDLARFQAECEEILDREVEISDAEALENDDMTKRYIMENYINDRVIVYETKQGKRSELHSTND